MSTAFVPRSSISMANERRVRQIVNASRATTTNRTKFEAACKDFRDICMQIREAIAGPSFKGSYDQILEVQKNNPRAMDRDILTLFENLRACNDVCKYEGEKLGYRGSEWWKACWASEK